ncbi:hypothetical protein J6590_100886 [Homalodisca vitripennis]|nr:hypothetical protein J6590_100886 [Homalodisca vitripennis]
MALVCVKMAYDPPKARLTWQLSGTQTLSVTHIRVNQWMSRRGILQLPDTVVEGWIDESNLLVRMTVDILPSVLPVIQGDDYDLMGSRREDAPSPNLTHPENPTTLEACSKVSANIELLLVPSWQDLTRYSLTGVYVNGDIVPTQFGHSVEAIAFPQCSPGIYTDNGRLHVEITWTMANVRLKRSKAVGNEEAEKFPFDIRGMCMSKIRQFTAYVTVSIVTEDGCWTSASMWMRNGLSVFQGDITVRTSAMTLWVLSRRRYHLPTSSIMNIQSFRKQR